jgi:hypothetical protein
MLKDKGIDWLGQLPYVQYGWPVRVPYDRVLVAYNGGACKRMRAFVCRECSDLFREGPTPPYIDPWAGLQLRRRGPTPWG